MARTGPYVEFSQALFTKICEEIADGASLRQVCEKTGMPDRMTFNRWRKLSPELQAEYDQASKDQEEATFDDIQYIADTVKDAAIARNMIDTRKWKLKIRNRKVYGDTITQELTGPEGGAIKTENIATIEAGEAYLRMLNGRS